MAISLVGSATTHAGGVTNPSFALPTGVQSGDVLVVWMVTHTNQFIATPNGWSRLFYENNSGVVVGALYYKVAGASETDPVVFTEEQSAGKCFICTAWRGVDNTTPIHTSATSTTAKSSPTITTTVDACMILALVGGAVRQATTFSAPSQGTQAASVNSATGTFTTCQAAKAYFSLATAGATGATTWTAGTLDNSKNATIALLPAASVGQPMLTRARLLDSPLLQGRLVR